MFTLRYYSLRGLVAWTANKFLMYLIIAAIPVCLYQLAGVNWLKISWLPLGTIAIALSFYLGFKNNSAYGRLWEARKIYGAIVNTSRSITVMARDFIRLNAGKQNVSLDSAEKEVKQFVRRHVAWMTALRYQLRKRQTWEHQGKQEERLRKVYEAPELEGDLGKDLEPYLSENDLEKVLAKKNRAVQLLGLQSEQIARLKKEDLLNDFEHMQIQGLVTDLYTQQGKAERIKNFPFPRQYASITYYLVWIFHLLLPFGLIHELLKDGNELCLAGDSHVRDHFLGFLFDASNRRVY